MISRPLFTLTCVWAVLACACGQGWLAVLVVPPMVLAMALRGCGL